MDERPRTATILVNRAARGLGRYFDPWPMVAYLRRREVEAHLSLPASALEATREAEAAALRGDHLLLVVGGDGTLRDTALGAAGSETALAAVPGGTVNIWARDIGIPRSMRAALETHLRGQRLRVDLGRADGRCFLLMAGIGWDAAVTRAVRPGLKRRFGDVAYVLEGLRLAPGLRTRKARWRTGIVLNDGPLALMVISNTRLYGGRVRFAPQASARDGQLDVAALCPRNVGEAGRLAWRLARGTLERDSRVLEGRVPELVFETPGFGVQLDGDYAGETPMAFRADEGALLVSVPAGPLAPVLRRE